MASIERSALVNYSAQAMYDLVNDVASYPAFMDGCYGAEVIEQTDASMLATLQLRKAGVQVNLTTSNKLTPHSRIEMHLQDGPFKSLRGLWSFTALSDDACKVSLDLHFEFSSRSLGLAASSLFSGVASNLVESLCKRANEVLSEEHNGNK